MEPLVSFADATATDNSGSATVSQTGGLSSGSTFPVGTTVVEYTATDAAGNTATCSFNVTVNDTEDPVISCPADVVVNVPFGSSSGVATFADATATDNCPGVSVEQTDGLSSGSSFPVGESTVEFTATDAAGNTAVCTLTVTVQVGADSEAPVISCPADIVVSNDPGVCGAVVSFADATATDNSGSATVSQTGGLSSGSTFPVGTTVVEYTATDAAGNTATCSFNVTVNDTEAPLISCPSDIVENVFAEVDGAVITWDAPTFSDNCSGATIEQTDGPTSGSFFNVNTTTTIEYTVTDASGLIAICSFSVTVNEGDALIISDVDDVIFSNDLGVCGAVITLEEPVPSNAVDVVTITNDAPSVFPIGTTLVTFTAVEANTGRTATSTTNVTILDAEDPTIETLPNIAVVDTEGDGEVVTFDDPSFGDNCPAAILTQTQGLSSGSIFPVGSTLVEFTVTDASGNTATTSFNVIVTFDDGCPDEPIQATLEETICDNESFEFDGQQLTEPGEYVGNFVTSAGCDSVVTLTLNVNPTFSEAVSETINEGESFEFGSQTLTEAGEYTEVFTSIDGCDSTVTLTLIVLSDPGGECTTPFNLALNKPATQSSIRGDGVPAFANDGNRTGNDNWGADANMMHTSDSDPQPWWSVDLGEIATLDYVDIYNRNDTRPSILARLSDFYVYVSSTPIDGSRTNGELTADPTISNRFFGGAAGPLETIQLDGILGRYVMIKVSGNGPLHMAEVEVYGCDDADPPVCDISLVGVSTTDVSDCGFSDGSITITATGNVEYSIGGAFQASNTFSGLSAGSYSITIREVGNPVCNATSSAIIGKPDDCKGEECITPFNLALNKPALQSSVYGDGIPSFANDGNTVGDDNWGFDANMMHTNAEQGAWWSVDLGSLATLENIVIYNRSDDRPFILSRLSEFYVYTSSSHINGDRTNADLSSDPAINNVFFPGAAGAQETLPLGGVLGRFVLIKLEGNGPLHMAEVEVYGCDGTTPPDCDINVVSVSTEDVSDCDATDGTISITATGGNLEYSIGGVFQSSNTFADLAAGNYVIIVRKASDRSCTATSTAVIGKPSGCEEECTSPH